MKGNIWKWLSRLCIVVDENEFHKDIITEGQGISAPVPF